MSEFSDQAIRDLKSSIGYMTPYKAKWGDAWKLYNNERVNRGYAGTADTFDPMCFNVVQTKVANVFGNKPRIVYWPKNPDQNQETKILTSLFNDTWERNRLSQGVITYGTSLFVTGNARMFAEWDADMDWIKWEHYPITDCLDDPTAKNPRSRRWGGYRFLTMLSDLKDTKVYDAEKDEWVQKYKSLSDIPLYSGNDDELDKSVKDCLEGSVLDDEAKKEQVEVTRLFYVKGPYAGKMIELANRSVAIYEDDSPFQRKEQKRTIQVAKRDDNGECVEQPNPQTGEMEPVMETKNVVVPAIKPFIPDSFQRNYTDGSLLYGMGEIEPIADLQELLNDTVNQVRDNVTHLINARTFIDPKFKDMIPTLKNVPNSVYAIPPLAIKHEEKPDTTASGYEEIMRIKQDIRSTSAIDEVTAGLQMQGKHTATEVNAQISQAGQRFGITLQALENEGFQDLAEVTYKMVQLFVTEEKILSVTGRQGTEWLKYNPDNYWGEYQAVCQLEQNAKAQNQDEIKRIAAGAQFLVNNPYVDQKEVTKIIATRLFQFDEDEAEQILVKNMPDMDEMKAQGAQMTASGQPQANPTPQKDNSPTPTVQEKIIESIDFADLPEDAKVQMLAQLGIQTQMASPTQQKVNLEGMKLQHTQQATELQTAADLHKHLTGHDLSTKQHHLEVAKATIAADQAQQNMENTQANAEAQAVAK